MFNEANLGSAQSGKGKMAWFRNRYTCADCGRGWADEWSCMCDDDCPHCGARHMSPFDSDDMTEVIIPRDEAFAVLRSPETAGHRPEYREIGRFATAAEAAAFLREYSPDEA